MAAGSSKLTNMDKSLVSQIPLDGFNILKVDPGTFAGGTANARGDKDGTKAVNTIAKVTGEVLVRIFGVCGTDLVGATATIEVGVVGNTATLIALTTATDIDANDIWNDAAPAVGVDTLANLTGPHIIVNGMDINEKVATADITAGELYYIILWRPLSPDGNVESAY